MKLANKIVAEIEYNGEKYYVPIELFDPIFRYQQKKYYQQDAEEHMTEIINRETGLEKKQLQHFTIGEAVLIEELFGFPADELEGIIEKAADLFEINHDCTLADNDQWECIIERLFIEAKDGKNHFS